MRRARLPLAAVLLTALSASSGAQSVHLGQTLIQPNADTTTTLIDMSGNVLHEWPGIYGAGISVEMLPDGRMMRALNLLGANFGSGGGFEILEWDGTQVWEFYYMGTNFIQHHDIERLPNGNVLLLAWDYKTAAEAVAQGRNPATIPGDFFAPDHIIEVQQTGPNSGDIVWEWHIWDHLIQDFDPSLPNYGVVAEHPELIDINYPEEDVLDWGDWNHCNSIRYNEQLDQIIISSRFFDEIWIIDHSTTTAEAASHEGGNSGKGGDLLWRWGNPHSYDHGLVEDRQLFAQHDARWIPEGYPGAGNVMVFSNGNGRPEGNYSTVEELVLPTPDANGNYPYTPGIPYGPAAPSWTWSMQPDPTEFFALFMGGANRLPNGNTLITEGNTGRIVEVGPTGNVLWDIHVPFPVVDSANPTFRVNRYQLCMPPENFCQTAPNSSGAGAVMSAFGSSSHTANDLQLSVESAAPNQFGVFFFGQTPIQIPFGDGFRCIGNGAFRLNVVTTDGAGSADWSIDVTDIEQPTTNLDVAETWYFQFWFRDPFFGGTGFNLSDGLRVIYCP